jgi:heme O synthase-like polyprenyltransferase
MLYVHLTLFTFRSLPSRACARPEIIIIFWFPPDHFYALSISFRSNDDDFFSADIRTIFLHSLARRPMEIGVIYLLYNIKSFSFQARGIKNWQRFNLKIAARALRNKWTTLGIAAATAATWSINLAHSRAADGKLKRNRER